MGEVKLDDVNREMSDRLKQALERARNHVMTPEEKFEQRVSFVYGQQDHDKPGLSKEEIREILIRSDGRAPDPRIAQLEAEIATLTGDDVTCPLCEGQKQSVGGCCIAVCRDGKVRPSSANILMNVKPVILTLQAEIAELRAALEPFAKAGHHIAKGEHVWIEKPFDDGSYLMAEDFKRAAAVRPAIFGPGHGEVERKD